MTQLIRHPGVVESTGKQVLRVRIVQTSGCAACRAKGYCSSADVREKLVDVPVADAASYHPGDSGWVSRADRGAGCCLVFGFADTLLYIPLVMPEADRPAIHFFDYPCLIT